MDHVNFSAGSDPVKDARKRLLKRLDDAKYDKKDVAKKSFYIDDDRSPDTFQELKARLDAGLYIWDKASEDNAIAKGHCWYGPFHFIQWRDPNKPADRVGYDAFKKQLDAAYENAKDAISVKEPKDGLQDLRDFQALVIQ